MKPTESPSPQSSPTATAPQGSPSPGTSARHVPPPHGPQSSSADPYDDGVPHHAADHGELHNLDVEHEHSDVNLRAIVMSAVMLTIVVIVSLVAMYLLFGWFERAAAANDPQLSPLASPVTRMPERTESPFFSTGVNGPQLLTNEPMVLQKHLAGEQERLGGYGWVDEKTGVAHMPIDEAKKLTVQRGLPVREGAVAPTFSVRPPARGEASGGRTITVAPPERPAETPAPPPQEQDEPPAAKPHGPDGQ